MCLIWEAKEIAEDICREIQITAVTIIRDLQAALRLIRSYQPGPGQVLAL